MDRVSFTVAERRQTLDRRVVERLMKAVLPEPIDEHFVVIAGRRFPPKQVISLATGADRADFNTHQARRILSRLGFTTGRTSQAIPPDAKPRPGPHGGREADALRPCMGQWVAQKGIEVMVAASSPQEVVGWLEEHNQWADAVFRVPAGESEATGMAPL